MLERKASLASPLPPPVCARVCQAVDVQMKTVLMHASLSGHAGAVRALLNAKADPNGRKQVSRVHCT